MWAMVSKTPSIPLNNPPNLPYIIPYIIYNPLKEKSLDYSLCDVGSRVMHDELLSGLDFRTAWLECAVSLNSQPLHPKRINEELFFSQS